MAEEGTERSTRDQRDAGPVGSESMPTSTDASRRTSGVDTSADAAVADSDVGTTRSDAGTTPAGVGTTTSVAGSDPSSGSAGTDMGGAGPLLPERDVEAASQRWHQIQSTFVDDPRRAIAEADMLVSRLVQQVTELFNAERSQFESLWDRGDEVSTEELRVGLQRYRSFFHRLLST